MQVLPDPHEKAARQQKRQDLFSLWSAPRAQVAESNTKDPLLAKPAPVISPQPSAGMDEVQRLIHRFSDPKADRMFLR